ncbi:DUF2584 family protein [Myxacorys almedinensis]|uniref:DUF2584 family protein n=1 Tax=Myxacorys almedinensis A TaxID=2690445 RepID=A0A8J7Z303_9CYAN|nr:DUF2584 family protein [Myxacorys almedinensis]NDJ18325.1 DUF2584 family protein [Myxacorys almedinensis A]
MGMPCEVNCILKLSAGTGYPTKLVLHSEHQATKPGYRIFAIDLPIPLVDENWLTHADVVIDHLAWQQKQTQLTFRIVRIYTQPFAMKEV